MPISTGNGKTKASASPGLRERNKRRTHNDIYESAIALFMARGYEEVTVDDICVEAGVSRATFFRYFENKYGLVVEFNRRIAVKIDTAVNLDEMTAIECIRLATDIMYDEWVHSAPQMRGLAFEFVRQHTHITEDLYDPMAKGLVRTLVEIIMLGQEKGDFTTLIEPRFIAPMILYGWTIAFVAWVDHRDEEAFNRQIHSLVEMQIAGMISMVQSGGRSSRKR